MWSEGVGEGVGCDWLPLASLQAMRGEAGMVGGASGAGRGQQQAPLHLPNNPPQ